MAFFDDINIDEDALRSPIWGAFELVKENIEGLIVINLLWSLQLVPGILGLALEPLPLWLRLLLIFYSVTALAPATGVLYGLAAYASQREMVTVELVKNTWRELAIPSMLRLAPLYGLFGVGLIGVSLSSSAHLFFINVILQVVLLWLLASSMYWGPFFVAHPDRSMWFLLKRSFSMVWRYPAPTTRTGIVIIVVALIGVISLGGIFLIVPVVIAILQSRRYQELIVRMRPKQR